MAPHMAASLPPSLPPSLHPFLSLSSTHSLHPRGATNLCCLCCHSVSLSFCFLSVCLSLSHYFHQSFLSPSLPLPPVQWGCSSTLRATGIWQREATNTCSSTLTHTYTNWHFTYRYRTVWLLECVEPLLKKKKRKREKKSGCFSTLNSSDLVPHNCWIICLSKKRQKKKRKEKKREE